MLAKRTRERETEATVHSVQPPGRPLVNQQKVTLKTQGENTDCLRDSISFSPDDDSAPQALLRRSSHPDLLASTTDTLCLTPPALPIGT